MKKLTLSAKRPLKKANKTNSLERIIIQEGERMS